MPLTLIVNNGAVVKRKTGETEWRHVLDREAARRILAETRHLEDCVAVVFDRPGERQIVFERMDWTHPNRRGYYEKNKAYIAAATSPLADVLTEDPIQVMFNGSVKPMRALFTALREMPIADRFSVAITEYEARDFSLVDVNGAQCSKGTTLARWAAARGIPAAEVMAVGDNLNDVEMLDFAGVAVRDGERERRAQVARLSHDGNKRRRRPRRRDPAARARAAECRKGRTRSRPIGQKLAPSHTDRHESIRTFRGRQPHLRARHRVFGHNSTMSNTPEPWRTACCISQPLGPRPGGFARHG